MLQQRWQAVGVCLWNLAYLQKTMPPCIKSSLELLHVAVLLWVDMLIGEVDRQPLN